MIDAEPCFKTSTLIADHSGDSILLLSSHVRSFNEKRLQAHDPPIRRTCSSTTEGWCDREFRRTVFWRTLKVSQSPLPEARHRFSCLINRTWITWCQDFEGCPLTNLFISTDCNDCRNFQRECAQPHSAYNMVQPEVLIGSRVAVRVRLNPGLRWVRTAHLLIHFSKYFLGIGE